MQITPDTARGIAKRSGGTQFVVEDLHTPQVNIAYGSYLLRELLDRYDGNVVAALAAYNAGPGKADEWGGANLRVRTSRTPRRASTCRRCSTRAHEYRRRYARELGL